MTTYDYDILRLMGIQKNTITKPVLHNDSTVNALHPGLPNDAKEALTCCDCSLGAVSFSKAGLRSRAEGSCSNLQHVQRDATRFDVLVFPTICRVCT